MKISKKIEYWVDIAEYDMKTADHMQRSGRYLYTAFMCQQAIEKILKALHIQKFGKEAPLTHNLAYLQEVVDINLPESDIELLALLTTYYIEGRYPSYKKKLSLLVDEEKASGILKNSKEVYQCLRSKIELEEQ